MPRAQRRPAPKVREPAERTRERILAAALEVFADHGFEGSRTREIAERAGANLGLIKYYFDGKEQLWKAAVTRAFAELQADFATALPMRETLDPLAWLERVIRQFVRFVARRPAFMRLMNDEAKRDSARMRWLADEFVRPMNDVMTAHVERAQADGLVAPIPPVSLRYVVLGAAGLVFSQAPECRYLTGVDPTDPDFAEQHAQAVIDMLRGRVAGGSHRSGRQRARRAAPAARRG